MNHLKTKWHIYLLVVALGGHIPGYAVSKDTEIQTISTDLALVRQRLETIEGSMEKGLDNLTAADEEIRNNIRDLWRVLLDKVALEVNTFEIDE